MAMIFKVFTGILKAGLNAVDIALKVCFSAINIIPIRRLSKRSSLQPSVVIVGASFAGLACQRLLSDDFNVTLIDYKSFFEYSPGVLRLFAEPSHFANIAKPLPCQRNHALVAEVVEVRPSEVVFTRRAPIGRGSRASAATGNHRSPVQHETLPFDYLVMACGSGYTLPVVKATSKDPIDLNSRSRAWANAAESLANARRVIVVGGGAVGVELVGEIAAAQAHRSKANKPGSEKPLEVVLVSRSPTLLPTLPSRAGMMAQAWLEQQPCVTLRMGVGATSVRSDGVTLDDGTELSADLVYHCGGATASPNAILQQHFGDCLDPQSGRLLVNNHLQVVKPQEHSQQNGGSASEVNNSGAGAEVSGNMAMKPEIFAAGDCILHRGSREMQLGHTAELNAHVVADNIIRLARYREKGRQRCVRRSTSDNQNQPKTSSINEKRDAASEGGPALLTYPEGAHGLKQSPQVYCVSLGPNYAVLCFNGLVRSGFLPALLKWLIEWTKVLLSCTPPRYPFASAAKMIYRTLFLCIFEVRMPDCSALYSSISLSPGILSSRPYITARPFSCKLGRCVRGAACWDALLAFRRLGSCIRDLGNLGCA